MMNIGIGSGGGGGGGQGVHGPQIFLQFFGVHLTMQLARPHVPFLYRIQRIRCVLDYVTEDDVYVSRGSCMYAMYTAIFMSVSKIFMSVSKIFMSVSTIFMSVSTIFMSVSTFL